MIEISISYNNEDNSVSKAFGMGYARLKQCPFAKIGEISMKSLGREMGGNRTREVLLLHMVHRDVSFEGDDV